MLSWFDGLREMSTLAILLKMCLAMACGGIIGLERELKRRAAGLRTHILICLGAAMTTLTSQYLLLVEGYYTDIARLGAQVIAGVGLIVAGTILVTRQNRVKGLTTAAGIWTTAIVGLCLGAGFYEGAITTTVLVLFTERVFIKLERRMVSSSVKLRLYVEYADQAAVDRSMEYFRKNDISISDLELTRSLEGSSGKASALLTLRVPRGQKGNRLACVEQLQETEGVLSAVEL